MIFATLLQVVVFTGLMLGCLMRFVIPAARKYQEIVEKKGYWYWDHSYTASTLFALLVSFFVSLVTLPTYPMPPESETALAILGAAAMAGWGLNDFIIEVKEWSFPEPTSPKGIHDDAANSLGYALYEENGKKFQMHYHSLTDVINSIPSGIDIVPFTPGKLNPMPSEP